MKTSVVLLSGGLDSTVLLAHLVALNIPCHALSFDYGQRHLCELDAAVALAQRYEVQHSLLRIDPQTLVKESSPLLDPKAPLDTKSSAFVPSRNLLFLSHAITFAQCRAISTIYFGATREDYCHYPDCRAPFFHGLQQVVSLGSPSSLSSIQLICPFLHATKAEIVTIGRALNVPLSMTWSCYNPLGKHSCGNCQACRMRISALSID